MDERQQVTVISSDLDGQDLRQTKHYNPYHVRCDGRADDAEVNEAIDQTHKQLVGRVWSISGEAWERIFNGQS